MTAKKTAAKSAAKTTGQPAEAPSDAHEAGDERVGGLHLRKGWDTDE